MAHYSVFTPTAHQAETLRYSTNVDHFWPEGQFPWLIWLVFWFLCLCQNHPGLSTLGVCTAVDVGKCMMNKRVWVCVVCVCPCVCERVLERSFSHSVKPIIMAWLWAKCIFAVDLHTVQTHTSDLNDLSWKNVGVIIFINLFLCYQVPSLLYTYWNLITVDILIYSLNYHHLKAQLLSPWSNSSNSILGIYLPVAVTKAMHIKKLTHSDSLLKKKHHGGVFPLYARRNSYSSLCFQGSFSTSC